MPVECLSHTDPNLYALLFIVSLSFVTMGWIVHRFVARFEENQKDMRQVSALCHEKTDAHMAIVQELSESVKALALEIARMAAATK